MLYFNSLLVKLPISPMSTSVSSTFNCGQVIAPVHGSPCAVWTHGFFLVGEALSRWVKGLYMGRTFYTLCPRELLWPSIYFLIEVAKSPDIDFMLFLFVKSFKHNSKPYYCFSKTISFGSSCRARTWDHLIMEMNASLELTSYLTYRQVYFHHLN